MLQSIFCIIRKCKSKKCTYQDEQYKIGEKDVINYTNLNFIIKKIKEVDYIKAIIFNRTQTIAFNFFHKPLINESNLNVNKIMNTIHNDQFKLTSDNKLDLIKNYFREINSDSINDYDAKILDLIDIEFA